MDLLANLQHWPLTAIVAILAGVAVLLAPRLLPYAVALYLLVVGALGLLTWYQGGSVRLEPLAALVAGILVLVKPAILSYVVGGYLILSGLLGAGVLQL